MPVTISGGGGERLRGEGERYHHLLVNVKNGKPIIEKIDGRIPSTLSHVQGYLANVLPFFVERNKARANLKAWVQSRWFAPNAFKQRGVQGKFSGVYMPYWTYDALTVKARLGLEQYDGEPYPAERMGPTDWPGLF